MISTKYGKMNVIPADKIVSHSLSLYGEWAGDELDFLHELIKPGMRVLDVGAFIGTHTLAFAQFVGETGQVYSFEPRKEIYELLRSNVCANDLAHVNIFNMGLAEVAGSITLESVDITESINFGGMSIDNYIAGEVNNVYEVNISTVDALDLSVVDFIKLDVEGMERRVLEGAVNVIARDLPLIFCECNSLSSGYEIFEFCQPLNYRVFSILSNAFNPNNFNGVSDNIFGDAKEISLLLVPVSKVQALELENSFESLIELKNLEDFVLPLLHKPQYAHEVLANTNSASKLSLYFPSPAVDRDRQHHKEAQKESEIALAEKHLEIVNFELQLTKLNQKISALIIDVEVKQQEVYSLHTDIQQLVTSTSWRITKPLRSLAVFVKKILKLSSAASIYWQRNPSVNGQVRLLRTIWTELRAGGLQALKTRFRMFRQAVDSPIELANTAAKQNADDIDELKRALQSLELSVETIIFDHNGGGGSNTYTSELINSTVSEHVSVLRVYCWGADWYVQLRNKSPSNNALYITADLDNLFSCLNCSSARNIIVNSLYGYKFIERAIDLIVSLKTKLSSTLDFKVHDFHSLCPSPHLSDYTQKYCGVPIDHDVCQRCLPRNLSWYHAWFDSSDMAVDIDIWRKPFQRLFDSCDVITCFDESSLNILQTDFTIDQSKVDVVPHELNYFKCIDKKFVANSLSIGVIGTLSHIKGGDVVKELCSYIDQEQLEVPVVVIGESSTQLPASAIIHGRYSPSELPSLVESLGVSVVFMASIVPETFSYTISEAIEMGMPIVAFDIGAQGRRVKEYRLGQVVPVGASPEEILNAAKSIHKAAKE
ncbi:FkbM family methyltransferase [Pseudomonas fluorescens]|uniref:Methyltransferase FkbM domain-containing protein n=1 Tax=Pseudomonas fluorescens TaxID=294 RepID=A0A5E7RMT1_PSEFL|nr:FkbM family methyltransferase [Pseudomonas fluorescens]VVP74798.1 hypothetical protein PS928_00150 [Pseudomonas fluorescens]